MLSISYDARVIRIGLSQWRPSSNGPLLTIESYIEIIISFGQSFKLVCAIGFLSSDADNHPVLLDSCPASLRVSHNPIHVTYGSDLPFQTIVELLVCFGASQANI